MNVKLLVHHVTGRLEKVKVMQRKIMNYVEILLTPIYAITLAPRILQ